MKKLLFVPLILAGALSVFADSFTDIIQDLAVQTACLGMYSMTEAGGGWYDDPHDYYTPQMMAERFAKMSGNMTRTTTFYGVCFDYAQCAWEDIVNYKGLYNENGMYERQFWLAGVHENPNEIELMSIAKQGESYTRKQNGVPIKTYSSSLRSVKTHRLLNKGDRATNHAWLWIERADGVWFWIDPTWTDNLGYVVYGYVKNGEEIQCRPDKEYCINYSDALNNLSSPPQMGNRIPPSKSANSTNREETIKDAGTGWILDILFTPISFFYSPGGKFKDNYNALVASVNVPLSTFKDKSLSASKMAFSLEMPCLYDYSHIIGLEYLQNIGDDYSIRSGLATLDFARRITNNVALYLGGGLGLRFANNAPSNLASTGYFAFKGNTGVLFNISRVFTKVDFAYDNVMGFSVGLGMGFAFYHERGK
ncbi:MAG: hypothetical protein K2J68_04430 [Treponemataceae bacterium]|nr:hypothetical protein [Treponemataceae bacterium]